VLIVSRGNYNGGSTIIRTGNAKKPASIIKKTALNMAHKGLKGYVLHKKSGDRYLSLSHGQALVASGSCRELGSWEGYMSIEYK
jgi:hypothetical protein